MATKKPNSDVMISLDADVLNKDIEQYKVFQQDGVTVKVPIGKITRVPRWVAELAINCGDATSYSEID